MKRVVLLALVLTSLSVFGQMGKPFISEVTFYGVDFSVCQVYGADESVLQFKNAFRGINELFLTEPKKYSVEKKLKVYVKDIDVEPSAQRVESIRPENLKTSGYGGYELTDEDVQEAVSKLPVAGEQGTGVVMIAEVLNKSSHQGTYKIVFFDTYTKKVLEIHNVKGRAKGFGLRNYWAGSVLGALNDYMR